MSKDIEGYAATYTASLGYEATMVRLRRRHVLAFLSRRPRGSVLEVGCGLEPLFAFYDGYDLHVTVEPAEQFAAEATRLASDHPRARVVRAYVEELPTHMPGAKFDTVVVSGALHEVPDPDAVLAAVREVCAPHALVHLNVPNARSFHRLLAVEMGLIRDVHETSALGRSLQRQREYDRDTLTATVERAGFRVTRFETYALKPLTHGQMQRLLDEQIVPANLPDALDALTHLLPEHGAEMAVEMVLR